MSSAVTRRSVQALISAAALLVGGLMLAPCGASAAMTDFEEEHLLSTEFATPHTAWARPYAGGKLRVLFIMNIGYCGTVPREAVELKQRFDLEAEAVFWANIIDSPNYHWHGDAAGLARLEQFLTKPWDCFVFYDCPVDRVPPQAQYQLLLAVTQGAGLVLIGGDDPRVLKPANQLKNLPPFLALGTPFANLPFAWKALLKDVAEPDRTDAVAAARLVSAYRVRQGRGVRLPARPVLDGDSPDWQTEYEYWQQLLGRAILWAASREPKVELTVDVSKSVVDVSELPASLVAASWRNPGGVRKLDLQVDLRRMDGQQIPLGLERATGADGRLVIHLPKLRAGAYFVDVRAVSPAGAQAWASAALTVSSTLRLAAVELDRAFAEVGETLSGKAVLDGLAAGSQATVRVDLVDARRRVIARSEATAAAAVPFRFQVEPWMPMWLRVEAAVVAGGQELSAASVVANVTQRHRGQFNFVVWDVPRGTLGPYGEESLARLGMTAHLSGGEPPRYAAAQNVAWIPYTTRITSPKNDKGYMQPVCWNDEPAAAAYVQGIVDKQQRCREHGVFVYSLGDEGVTRGACVHPACLAAYRRYLETEYQTIPALNASWGTSFGSFAEVQLSAAEDSEENTARQQGSYPRWYDRQAFQSYNFAQFCGKFVAGFQQLDPLAKTGFEGAGAFDQGDDYDLIVRTNTFWSPYPGLGDEIIRSIAPREFPRSNWMGYTRDADTLLSKYWRMITRGCDSVWWWRWDGVGIFHGLLAPHLGPYEATKELVKDTQVVRDGLGTLLIHSEMLDDGVAILYSMPSAYACRVGDGPAYGAYAAAHEAWSRLIRGLGLQYRYITDRMLRQGEFKPETCRVLILARTEALGPQEAETIRRYVDSGGTVIADLRPGLFDGHCKPLGKGALDELFGVERAAGGQPLTGKAGISGSLAGVPVAVDWDKATCEAGLKAVGGRALGACGETPLAIVRSVGKGQAILLNFAAPSFPALAAEGTPPAAGDFLDGLFVSAKVRPVIAVRGQDGGRATNLEVVRWRDGDTDLLAVFRENGQRETLRIELPEARCVYDLRQRSYLGHKSAFATEVIPCRATFFALVPARLDPPEMVPSTRSPTRGELVKLRLSGGGAGCQRAVVVRASGPDQAGADVRRQVVLVPPAGTTLDLPIAWNDPVGKWTVTVTELFTNQSRRTTLTVR